MATHSKSVPTPPVWTSAFTPVVADALALSGAGQKPRHPRHLTSCGSKACSDTPVVPPPSSWAFVPQPRSLTSAPPYSNGAALVQLEGCNGSTSTHEQARGGSGSKSNKRMAYEANDDLDHVQLHNQKSSSVGGRRPRMTPNVHNYDQKQTKVNLKLSAGFDRTFGVALCTMHMSYISVTRLPASLGSRCPRACFFVA